MSKIFVERLEGFRHEAKGLYNQIQNFLDIHSVHFLRYFNYYDVRGLDKETLQKALPKVFYSPQSDKYTLDSIKLEPDEKAIMWEYLPGQFDIRADSAVQCLSILKEDNDNTPITVKTAHLVLLKGEEISEDEIKRIKEYLINNVDSCAVDFSKIQEEEEEEVGRSNIDADIYEVKDFNSMDENELSKYKDTQGLAMDIVDIKYLQDYFKGEGRCPTLTEIKVLDTYWSDHCRHTTFLTHLDVEVADGIFKGLYERAISKYKEIRKIVYDKEGEDKHYPCLMDVATIGARLLKKEGVLKNLEVSKENNAYSFYAPVFFINKEEEGDKEEKKVKEEEGKGVKNYLVMFKNETHNHPTEIEPFGGAATCIGGAIRDPLSARSYVYQAMRVTGAGDPTVSKDCTLKGKLPQIKICREAMKGFSSYGNQIGLATGQVCEVYHPGYTAKRLEAGAVIAAAPVERVKRIEPCEGDVVILLGGDTGRDGIGGATGSSKVHNKSSVKTASSEVQKGCAVEERKIQRLFRKDSVCAMIKRCNDFGAGGVAVAVGEVAAGLNITLDNVPKKYEGLNGAELAISESQERMAVVVSKEDANTFIQEAKRENLKATPIATVTSDNRLVMKWQEHKIVDLKRSFLDSAGAVHKALALLDSPLSLESSPIFNMIKSVEDEYKEYRKDKISSKEIEKLFLTNISDLSCSSQKGLVERFDSTIGAASILFPYGGERQLTSEVGMASLIPVEPPSITKTASLMTEGYEPYTSEWSAYHGAIVSVILALTKLSCIGGEVSSAYLSFQEFFGRAIDKHSWGQPLAALLGALDAQEKLKVASIGGKDSMSGSYTYKESGEDKTLNVPNTLIAFAVGLTNSECVTSGEFKSTNSKIYLVRLQYNEELTPDYDAFLKNTRALHSLITDKKVTAAYPIQKGGIAECISKMAMGNGIGAVIESLDFELECKNKIDSKDDIKKLFSFMPGSFMLETEEGIDASLFTPSSLVLLGHTIEEDVIKIEVKNSALPYTTIKIDSIVEAGERRLNTVYPIVSEDKKKDKLPEFATSKHSSIKKVYDFLLDSCNKDKTLSYWSKKDKEVRIKEKGFSYLKTSPLVLLPIFPGTNCEYDMERAFKQAGGKVKSIVIRNKTQEDLKTSLKEFSLALKETQILGLSGGFSAADEPDGSAKFIANCLLVDSVAEEVMQLIERKGLILGICNGFQALVKTGLVLYGKFSPITKDTPTLTYNTIGQHISRIVRTKIVSAISPWAYDRSVLDNKIHKTPISHGEGRFITDEKTAKELFSRGQVFSQYVTALGEVATKEPDNPNGSSYAIEGLTSPNGLILGKMAHNERNALASFHISYSKGSIDKKEPLVMKNILSKKEEEEGVSLVENIFNAGINYFKG